MSPSEFSEEMLRVVRCEFYQRPEDSKTFFQERSFLLRAITFPAAYLHKRGAMLPASNYRRILSTVIETIKAKGNRAKIERFSVYFLHCVQSHMEHHGEKYYYAGKSFEGRSISPQLVKDVVGGALRTLRKGTSDQTVPILAEVHRALTVRGRIQRAKKATAELELPGLCNPIAKRAH
jgi:hypothetical protein